MLNFLRAKPDGSSPEEPQTPPAPRGDLPGEAVFLQEETANAEALFAAMHAAFSEIERVRIEQAAAAAAISRAEADLREIEGNLAAARAQVQCEMETLSLTSEKPPAEPLAAELETARLAREADFAKARLRVLRKALTDWDQPLATARAELMVRWRELRIGTFDQFVSEFLAVARHLKCLMANAFALQQGFNALAVDDKVAQRWQLAMSIVKETIVCNPETLGDNIIVPFNFRPEVMLKDKRAAALHTAASELGAAIKAVTRP